MLIIRHNIAFVKQGLELLLEALISYLNFQLEILKGCVFVDGNLEGSFVCSSTERSELDLADIDTH